jgi:hypothetical protein
MTDEEDYWRAVDQVPAAVVVAVPIVPPVPPPVVVAPIPPPVAIVPIPQPIVIAPIAPLVVAPSPPVAVVAAPPPPVILAPPPAPIIVAPPPPAVVLPPPAPPAAPVPAAANLQDDAYIDFCPKCDLPLTELTSTSHLRACLDSAGATMMECPICEEDLEGMASGDAEKHIEACCDCGAPAVVDSVSESTISPAVDGMKLT